MEPFIKPESQSAGQAALDVLFPQGNSPGGNAGTPKAAEGTPASSEEAPTESPVELGDHGKLGDVPGEPAEANAEAASPEAGAKPAANILEVPFTDAQGRRVAKVDLNDREALTRQLSQSFGFRKMQAERDQLKQQIDKSGPRLKELEENWASLEKSYQEGGIEGLVDLLGGKKGHYKEFLASEVQKANRYATATQAEKERIDLEERLARVTREGELREKRAAEEAKKAVAEREAADLSKLESQITPAFNKHRFAGTLGNEAQEKALDQAIWDQAIRNLEALPEEQALTQELIDKEFRSVATMFRAAIGKQANAKVKQVIDKTKQTAQTQVAAAATRAMGRPTGIEQSMVANVRRGGLDGLTSGLMDVLRMGRR